MNSQNWMGKKGHVMKLHARLASIIQQTGRCTGKVLVNIFHSFHNANLHISAANANFTEYCSIVDF